MTTTMTIQPDCSAYGATIRMRARSHLDRRRPSVPRRETLAEFAPSHKPFAEAPPSAPATLPIRLSRCVTASGGLHAFVGAAGSRLRCRGAEASGSGCCARAGNCSRLNLHCQCVAQGILLTSNSGNGNSGDTSSVALSCELSLSPDRRRMVRMVPLPGLI